MSTFDGAGTRPARWIRESRRHRVVLVTIVVLGVVLTSWNLAHGGDSDFYAAAARSMSESLPAFLTGSFDPGATVTLDKLAGFAVPQAISVHLFGMSTAALALPQVVEGAITTLAVSVVGLRWAGPRAGLVAAALAASTPIFVSMFGHPMEDGLLTMALAVAFVWWQRAAITGAWWPLLLAGLFVGVGFQAKMLQAWLVLPAFAVGTVVAALAAGTTGSRWRRAVLHTAVLLGATLVASLAWSVVLELVPATDRPFIDGSTNDDVWAMVLGYNGIDRFLPGAWPGAVGALGSAIGHVGGQVGGHLAQTFRAAAGGGHGGHQFLQLFSPRYASQVGWSWPAALFGIGIGAARWRARRGSREARTASVTLLTVVVWLVTAVVVLSALRLPHTAYVAAVGVQLAVLGAVGWWGAASCVDAADRRLRVVPLGLLVVQGAWWTWLARTSSEPLLLGAVAVGVTIAAVIALLLYWSGRSSGEASGAASGAGSGRAPAGSSAPFSGQGAGSVGRGGRVAAGLLVAAVVLGPACFSLQVLDAARDGSGGDASVGVVARGGFGAFGGGGVGGARGGLPQRAFALGAGRLDRAAPSAPFTISPPDVLGGTASLTATEASLVRTAERDGGGRSGTPLFMTDTWRISADVIRVTGDEVLTDGGFSGHVPVFTEQRIEQLIRSGQVRLFVVADGGNRASASDPVRQATAALGCEVVRRWGAGAGGAGVPFGSSQAFALERCR